MAYLKNKFVTVALLLMLPFAAVVYSDDSSSDNSEAGSRLYTDLTILGGSSFFSAAVYRVAVRARPLALENNIGLPLVIVGSTMYIVYSTVTGSIVGCSLAITIDYVNQSLQAD